MLEFRPSGPSAMPLRIRKAIRYTELTTTSRTAKLKNSNLLTGCANSAPTSARRTGPRRGASNRSCGTRSTAASKAPADSDCGKWIPPTRSKQRSTTRCRTGPTLRRRKWSGMSIGPQLSDGGEISARSKFSAFQYVSFPRIRNLPSVHQAPLSSDFLSIRRPPGQVYRAPRRHPLYYAWLT